MNASGNHYTTSHRDPLQASSLCLRAEQQIGIEAAVVAGVACRADLVDLEQHRVAVAVQSHRMHVLGVTGRLTLAPVLLARARVIHGLAGFNRVGQRAVLLRHRGEQPVGVALQPRRDACVQRHRRTTIPSAAIAAFTSPIVSSRKWNTLAASTASAPATTAGAKCSTAPAPPLAITGTVTAPRTARSILRSKPALVPSSSIELSRISPTPSSAPRVAHSIASMPVPLLPPCVVTSQPDAVGASPAGTVRASTESTM